jgi:hypothetical protein
MTKQTVTNARVIWDTDHGAENQGWYVRFSLDDGQERDVPFEARRDIGLDRARKQARLEARNEGFHMPNGTPVQIEGQA